MHTLAGAQLQQPPEQTIKSLQQIVQGNRNPQISAMASYELGRQLWSSDKPDDALFISKNFFRKNIDFVDDFSKISSY